MCRKPAAAGASFRSSRHPLRVYAQLELGIGAFGLLILFAMPVLGNLYVANAGHGVLSMLLRAVLAMICLLPPTVLMGATLPAVARWVESTPQGVSWLGFFYGGNIAGAVIGSLVAGFYLLRVYDMATATYVAAAINAAAAAIAWMLVRTRLWSSQRSCAKCASHKGSRYGCTEPGHPWRGP